MKSQFLSRKLHEMDEVEKQQIINGININDQHLDYQSPAIPKMPKESFFKEGDIFINKHHRFSYMPAHTHNFIEFNYMYCGSCTQYINDEKIVLHEHEIILIDKDIIQRIDYVGEHDILINILLKDDSIIDLLKQHIGESTSIVTKFMYHASRMDSLHNNFMIFNIQENEVAQNLLESMILKSLETSPLKNQSLQLMMALLLSELSHCIEKETSDFSNQEANILPVLKYIDDHYATITLADLSEKFGYNTNYLGNKLKDETGSTFKELIDKKRLDIAQELLLNTNYTMDDITDMIGFKSAPSLFRLFKKHTGLTPLEFKSQYKHI